MLSPGLPPDHAAFPLKASLLNPRAGSQWKRMVFRLADVGLRRPLFRSFAAGPRESRSARVGRRRTRSLGDVPQWVLALRELLPRDGRGKLVGKAARSRGDS